MEESEYDENSSEVDDLESYMDVELSYIRSGGEVLICSGLDRSSQEWICSDSKYAVALDYMR